MCDCPYKNSRWCAIKYLTYVYITKNELRRICPITRSDKLKISVEELKERIHDLEKLSERLKKLCCDTKPDIPCLEDQSKDILMRGQSFSLKGAKYFKGTPHECHWNSAKMYKTNPDIYRICTGYALFTDEWYQHTWLIYKENGSSILIEPTIRFQQYFGFEMTAEESDTFCEGLSIRL